MKCGYPPLLYAGLERLSLFDHQPHWSFDAFVALIAKVLGVIGLASSSHFWTAWAMVF